MYYSSAYRLKLYREFKAIDPKDTNGIIRYYEKHEEELHQLNLDEHIDCVLTYITALFDTDDFLRHNVMCDYMIELVMTENIENWGGEDLFLKLLYNKAVAYSRMYDWDDAVRILTSLVRIAPDYPSARMLLFTCMLRQNTPIRSKGRSMALFFILLSAVSAGSTALAVQPHFPEWLGINNSITIGLFACGVSAYSISETIFYYSCKRKLKNLGFESRLSSI